MCNKIQFTQPKPDLDKNKSFVRSMQAVYKGRFCSMHFSCSCRTKKLSVVERWDLNPHFDSGYSLSANFSKCKKQNMPLYTTFIDLTNDLDLVSKEVPYAILLKIGFPLCLFNIVKSFKTNTNGNVFDSFTIKVG